MHELDSSCSSCSSFDPSDNEGTYPSTPSPFPLFSPISLQPRPQRSFSQDYPDNFLPAFELSPVIEEPTTFNDVDDILAYYSNAPVLDHIGFDESNWESEIIFDAESESEPKLQAGHIDNDAEVGEIKRARRMSYILKPTQNENCSTVFNVTDNETNNSAFKNFLSPPALVLTFPTPELPSTLPDPIPLITESSQLSPMGFIPQTPPASTHRHLGDSLLPPTPLPHLPRCTSCGFGFAFDSVSSSIDTLPRLLPTANPCNKCQGQWDRCQRWYGKRGRMRAMSFKRASQRLSQIMEGVLSSSDRTEPPVNCPPLDVVYVAKRSSKRLSFMLWNKPKHEGSVILDQDSAAQPPQLPLTTDTSSAPEDVLDSVQGPSKSRFTGIFSSKSKVSRRRGQGQYERKGRRSFLNFGSGRSQLENVSYRQSHAG
ncbi:hypothetical protein BDP27DRAFT_1326737 [Rhodocollybia butyracea]|uniref:Uncharacterized protein n=1 Tax=Rhodocollybia butyracea TaxID=206335 RepID=A0A9P5U7B6_9AGAR|nr:hypothetical protein BDP27DRAFT_1326737 [Rhodocollybia butyracea]